MTTEIGNTAKRLTVEIKTDEGYRNSWTAMHTFDYLHFAAMSKIADHFYFSRKEMTMYEGLIKNELKTIWNSGGGIFSIKLRFLSDYEGAVSVSIKEEARP